MLNTEYPTTATPSIHVRRAGSELLNAADLADEPIKTHLFRVAQLCDETLAWLWQQQTAPRRKGAA